jgi:hypothetical protein
VLHDPATQSAVIATPRKSMGRVSFAAADAATPMRVARLTPRITRRPRRSVGA